MLVAAYNDFVRATDQYKDRPASTRQAISRYGVVGEIGSLVSAVKKKLLAEDGPEHWDKCNEEIVWEIGDVIWYCFSLAQVENEGRQVNILTNNIATLKKEIAGKTRRAEKIHAALDPARKDAFLEAAKSFPNTPNLKFSDYQKLAFLTARTDGRVLLQVCLAVLWQLGAELLRHTLPEIEIALNDSLPTRKTNVILGDIAWHLAAVASVYGRSLDDIVAANVKKLEFRSERSERTPLYDEIDRPTEQFPRKMSVAFVSVGPGQSRMYLDGKMLGNTLNDNSHVEDGYRFHDVMHLSNLAFLGWSPVLRGFLKRKRKSRGDRTDEVEDGARAQLVEEVVLKAIHSEGVSLVRERGDLEPGEIIRLFPTRTSITFRLLRIIQEHVVGLEVEANKFWEWEDAIFEGAAAFFELRKHEQGTITVDLEQRSIAFSPIVSIELKGAVVGMGMAMIARSQLAELSERCLTDIERHCLGGDSPIRHIAAKFAILSALGFEAQDVNANNLELTLLPGGRVCTKARDQVRERIWKREAIAHQLMFTETVDGLYCTAIALADANAR